MHGDNKDHLVRVRIQDPTKRNLLHVHNFHIGSQRDERRQYHYKAQIVGVYTQRKDVLVLKAVIVCIVEPTAVTIKSHSNVFVAGEMRKINCN